MIRLAVLLVWGCCQCFGPFGSAGAARRYGGNPTTNLWGGGGAEFASSNRKLEFNPGFVCVCVLAVPILKLLTLELWTVLGTMQGAVKTLGAAGSSNLIPWNCGCCARCGATWNLGAVGPISERARVCVCALCSAKTNQRSFDRMPANPSNAVQACGFLGQSPYGLAMTLHLHSFREKLLFVVALPLLVLVCALRFSTQRKRQTNVT